MQPAIGVGARVHPAAEHGADGAPHLLARVLREGAAEVGLHHRLVLGDHRLPMRGRQGRVLGHAGVDLGALDDLLEAVVVHAQHDRAVHLDEAAIAVPGEARIPAGLGQAADRLVVQAEVQHRVHHAGHRHARAGADGDEQRVRRVAEAQADRVLDAGQRLGHLAVELARIFPAVVVERGADLGRDGEPGGDRQADRGHLRQVGALAAQQVAHVGATLVVAGAETVHPLGHRSALDTGEVGHAVHGGATPV